MAMDAATALVRIRRDLDRLKNATATTWSTLTGKPSTFPPDTHAHPQSDVTGLVAALSGKEATGVAAGLIAAHESAVDPHPVYLTSAEGNAAYSAAGHSHSGLAPTGGATGEVLKKNSNTNYDYSWAADATGGGGSGGAGVVEVDFGAFPGTSDVSTAITGQAGILAGSVVNAWIMPAATTDHSADEHWVETIKVMAGNIVAATGFTIYARNDCQVSVPAGELRGASNGSDGTRLYGKFNVAWDWK